MLNGDEQERIIRANREAFEELALRWRNPQTGETQTEVRAAVVDMLCDYFRATGCSDDHSETFSALYDATQSECRNELHLTLENQLSAEARAVLKRLRPNDYPGYPRRKWAWDEGEWDWELQVRDMVDDVDCGYIAIVPLKDGGRFEHRVKPPPSHTQWAIRFILDSAWVNDILIKGSLGDVKRRLDMLLGCNTPELLYE